MSNMFKSNLVIKLEGTSHSLEMAITITNFPKGIFVDEDKIKEDLKKRRPNLLLSNARSEDDEYLFVSGVKDNYTTGEELKIVVKNKNFNKNNYHYGDIRPGHADYPAYIKYQDKYDYYGGGQFSGRLTVLIVIFAVLAKEALKKYGVRIASHIKQIGNIFDDKLNYSLDEMDYLNNHLTINQISLEKMNDLLIDLKKQKDSIGGEIETYAKGVKIGLGNDYFGGLESKIAYLMYAIPGAKDVYFGRGNDACTLKGSEFNDFLEYNNDKVEFLSNNSGGINGGLANGEDIIVNVKFKPTSSIGKIQKSINIVRKENIDLQINGNHDTCFAYRCGVIVEGMLAIALLDSYLEAC